MMAVTFFLAAGLAAWSARPIAFAAPGQDFSDFEADIAEQRSLEAVLKELGPQLDECAKENQLRIAKNALLFKSALVLAASAPLIGGIVAVLEM